MVCFQTKNPNLSKFWKALDWKMLIYFMAIWNILRTYGIFYDHLAQFVFIWYIFFAFGIMHQEKSGNPGRQHFYLSSALCNVGSAGGALIFIAIVVARLKGCGVFSPKVSLSKFTLLK
jgi:hypothetical protein